MLLYLFLAAQRHAANPMDKILPLPGGMAQAMGFDIVQFVLPLAMLLSYAFFLPFNTMGNIIMFGAGYYTVAEQVKSSVALGLLSWGCWALTAFTWWKIVGFL